MFDSEIEGAIHPRLDTLPPGPILAAFLSAVDVAEVAPHDRVKVLRAHQRMASHYLAEVYRDMVAIVNAYEGGTDDLYPAPESAAAEIRAALTLTRRAADVELEFALDLKERLPRIWQALAAGDIDLRRTRVLVAGTAHLSESKARRVAAAILPEAPALTTGQLAARLRRMCIEIQPGEAVRRYEEAVSARRVTCSVMPEGTTNLHAVDLPPHRASAAMARINHLARTLKTSTETRTMDQLRADVLLDLIEGKHADRGEGSVEIRVDLDTLTGLSESPAELAGYGPVIADIARQVAADHEGAGWRYAVTDPRTGRILHDGTTRRRPTAAQRRTVVSRTETCVFPGCRMPAAECDLDHRAPWIDGGPTDPSNLAPLCRHDHVIKTRTGWTYRPIAEGAHQWTSPFGHTYTTTGKPP